MDNLNILSDETGNYFLIYSVVGLESYEPNTTLKSFLSKSSAESFKKVFEKSQKEAEENLEKRNKREDELISQAISEVTGLSQKEYYQNWKTLDYVKVDNRITELFETDEEFKRLDSLGTSYGFDSIIIREEKVYV